MITKLSLASIVVLVSLTAAFAGGWGMEGAFLQTGAVSAFATTQTAGDCNGNGVPDDEDITAGTSQDCNQNGRPDECDFVADLTATGTAYTEGEGSPRAALNASFFYVHPPTGSDRYVGQVSTSEYLLKDIAVDPTDQQIYTVSVPMVQGLDDIPQYLYVVDPVTGAGTPLPQPTGVWPNYPVLGLTFGLDGTLYGIGPYGMVILDKTTGEVSQVLNADVYGFGMATSSAGDLYSIMIELGEGDLRSPVGASLLQLHDKATGDIVSSVPVIDPVYGERQIVDIAFGADGQLYGIAGYVYIESPYYFYITGFGLVQIDPATGSWTDIGPFIGDLGGLGGPRYSASLDCNENAIPDECEPDCNSNGIPDGCDIASGTSKDCNANSVPDECDLAFGTSLDCNQNGVPDECDIAGGASADLDGDGVPDDCQTPGPQEQPEGQPAPGGPLCILFLFQSIMGIPLCGPCWLVGMFSTLVGLSGMKWYARRRFRR